MNFMIYTIISVVLFVSVLLFYIILKPKKSDIQDEYSKYLLREVNPDVAFTHKRLHNGKYLNYYLNYDASNPNLLTSSESDYPVTSTGAEYHPIEHGTVTVTNDGFKISGCDKAFTCPNNWIWNETIGSCEIEPICGSDDDGKLKGIDQYHFYTSEIQAALPESRDSNVKYHDKLYVQCGSNGNFVLKECPQYTGYNQLESQPANEEPCKSYDVCEELREYTIHKIDVDGTILSDKQYYICLNNKSVMKECSADSVFNTDANACIEVNPCALKPNGFTIANTDDSFITCNNGLRYTIFCSEGVYTGHGEDKLECNINKDKTIRSYYTNAYMSIPESLYIYNDNKMATFIANKEEFTRQMKLKPQASNFFKIERNSNLYPTVTFRKNFARYKDASMTTGQSIKLDINNYMPFVTVRVETVSYYVGGLSTIQWDMFQDKPVVDGYYRYYKYDTTIKDSKNAAVHIDSINYFHLNVANYLYAPKNPYNSASDANTGMLYYADFALPTVAQIQDRTLNLAFKVLDHTITSDGKFIMYYADAILGSLVAIVWAQDAVSFNTFDNDPDTPGFLVPRSYNVQPLEFKSEDAFSIRMSSIKWDGSTNNYADYVLPEMLLCIAFSTYDQLDNKFSVLNTELITLESNLSDFKKASDLMYNPSSQLNGNSLTFKTLQNSLNTHLLITTPTR